MENLVPPMVTTIYPSLAERGQFDTAIAPETRLDWIAAQDIGAFAAAAFADPERFHRREIELAGDTSTLPDLAAKLTKATGKPVSSVSSSEEEMLARGVHPLYARSETWYNVEGWKVDLDAVHSWGLPLTTLDELISENRDKFVIG